MAFIESLCVLWWYSSLRNIRIDFAGQKSQLVLLLGLCGVYQEMIWCHRDERNPAVSVFKMSAALLCVSKAYQAAWRSNQRNWAGRVCRTWACLICTARDTVHKTNSASVERTSQQHYSTPRQQHLCWFPNVCPSLLLLIIHSGDVLCSKEQYVMHSSRWSPLTFAGLHFA